MKKLVILSRRLSDWHMTQFKNYIYIAFNNVKELEIEYDIESEGATFVTYKLKRGDKRKSICAKKELERRLEAVSSWTKNILWQDLTVSVFLDDKKIL